MNKEQSPNQKGCRSTAMLFIIALLSFALSPAVDAQLSSKMKPVFTADGHFLIVTTDTVCDFPADQITPQQADSCYRFGISVRGKDSLFINVISLLPPKIEREAKVKMWKYSRSENLFMAGSSWEVPLGRAVFYEAVLWAYLIVFTLFGLFVGLLSVSTRALFTKAWPVITLQLLNAALIAFIFFTDRHEFYRYVAISSITIFLIGVVTAAVYRRLSTFKAIAGGMILGALAAGIAFAVISLINNTSVSKASFITEEGHALFLLGWAIGSIFFSIIMVSIRGNAPVEIEQTTIEKKTPVPEEDQSA